MSSPTNHRTLLSPRFTKTSHSPRVERLRKDNNSSVQGPPLTGPETTMLAGIEFEHQQLDHCPSLDYLDANSYVLEKISEQFYNIESQRAITCVIRSFLRNPTRPKNPTEAVTLSNQLRDYLNEPELGRYITIQTVETDRGTDSYPQQVQDLIREAYIATVYLNELRDLTPAFKYVYAILVCGKPTRNKDGQLIEVCEQTGTTPYLIEESLFESTKLAEVIDRLPENEAGTRVIKSFIFQLLMAAYYAHEVGVTNIPFEVVARPVPPEADLPFFLNDLVVHVATYGWVLTFNKYGSASFELLPSDALKNHKNHESHRSRQGSYGSRGQIMGDRETLEEFQGRLVGELLDLVRAINPGLYKIFPYPDNTEDLRVTSDYFADILVDPEGRVESLTCQDLEGKVPCMTLEQFVQQVQIPFARLDSYVRSSVDRIDYLSELLRTTTDQDTAFIVTPVILEYIQSLERIYEEVDKETRERLFPGERHFNLAINPTRYQDPGKFIIKPDYEFIQSVKPLMTAIYNNKDAINLALDRAIAEGRNLFDSLKTRELPELTSLEGLKLAIQGLRDTISDIKYDETTNALVMWYRQYIGPYSDDLSKELEETQFFKSKYQQLLAEHPGVLDKLLKKVDTADQAILARLYDVFVEDLSDPLETSLKGFENRSSPEDRQSIINLAYQQKVVASDPIPVILGQVEPTVTFSSEPLDGVYPADGVLPANNDFNGAYPVDRVYQPTQEFNGAYPADGVIPSTNGVYQPTQSFSPANGYSTNGVANGVFQPTQEFQPAYEQQYERQYEATLTPQPQLQQMYVPPQSYPLYPVNGGQYSVPFNGVNGGYYY